MAQLKRRWWKEGVVYQIYPRSFQDTSGNGIGDLKGITKRLDYIKSLGVNIIWLCPVYESPNDDNGYDIANYRKIMAEFGTMQDFDDLLAEMKLRGLKLVMDLVANHTSDEHFWFQESRKSRDNEYRDYYHWWPAEKGTPPKRWSYFDIDANAWKYDEKTDSHYLHYFSVKQPDLKWENPAVRKEVYDMLRFWFDKGVDGFRMDVIPFISKDTTYPELPKEFKGDFIPFYSNGPRLHEFLNEMNNEVLSKYDIMTVGEALGVTIDQALNFVDEDRKELNMFFHFDLMSLDRDGNEAFWMRSDRWKLTEFKEIHSKWDAVFSEKGWGTMYLNNHDFPRAVSRWGNDSKEHWRNSATMLQTFLLTMRGTPFFYFGEEIGMTNANFERLDDYKDINTLNRYKLLQQQNIDLEDFIENEKKASRDNARTPMQWSLDTHAGFTNDTPWIKVNSNYKTGINVEEQEKQSDSVLNYFRKMVKIRKSHLGLIYGSYQLVLPENEQVYAYTRSLDTERYLILLSFSEESTQVTIDDIEFSKADLLISNDECQTEKTNHQFTLKPYQAVVYQLH